MLLACWAKSDLLQIGWVILALIIANQWIDWFDHSEAKSIAIGIGIISLITGSILLISANRFWIIVTGFTRAQIFSGTHNHDLEDDLLAYATDSITTRKQLGSNFASDNLGEMKIANQASDLFMIIEAYH